MVISNIDNKLYKSKKNSLLVIAIALVTLLIFTSASNYGSSAFLSSIDNSVMMMRMSKQSQSFHTVSQHVMLTPTQIYNRAGNSVVFITAPTNNGVFSGSGFFFDAVGHIITNRHVVFDATNVIVTLSNGNKYAAKIIGSDFYMYVKRWLKGIIYDAIAAIAIAITIIYLYLLNTSFRRFVIPNNDVFKV